MPYALSSLLALLLFLASRSTWADAAEIAARIRDGDREAFRTFFDRHHARLIGYVRSRGVPSGPAEDLVQDAFVYVWTNRDAIDPEKSLRAYLFRIGYTRALNYARDASKEDAETDPVEALDALSPDSVAGPEMDVLRGELRDRIDTAVRDLPDRRRAVFEMCFLQGLTYREAAEQLDVARKTVENHMRLALQDLREALSDLL